MKAQVKAQDVLPGIEVERHPMWQRPDDNESMPRHIRALCKTIARNLIPFDGRPGIQAMKVTTFAANVHMLTTLETSQHDSTWLLGRIAVAYHDADAEHDTLITKHFIQYVEAVITCGANSQTR